MSVSGPNHPEVILINDFRFAGDKICSECGLVVGDRVIDISSEWRTFSSDGNKADPCRVGASENTLLDGYDISTVVGPSTSGPAYGKPGAGMQAEGSQENDVEQ